MDRNEGLAIGCLLGFVVGFIAMCALLSISNTYHSLGKHAIQECQKELPRNLKCKIIAIPEEVLDDN